MRIWGRFLFFATVLYTLVVSLWTTEGVSIYQADRHNGWHHYEYLVDGFLAGHTYLALAPDPAMLALKDPYDANQNSDYHLWDASLYKGKYYLYYGPTPALICLLPYRILTGHHMPQRIAVSLFGCLGLLALATITLYLRKTYFPDISWGWTTFVYFVIAHACWMPVLLRRPAVWELPIASALALAWWGLYCLMQIYHNVDALGQAKMRMWCILSGVCFGLTLGCRPTYLIGISLISLIFLLTKPKQFLYFITPIFLAGVGLLIYNYERFGSIREFGQSYQLWGFQDRTVPLFKLDYFSYNLWVYIFAVPQLSPYFPFVHPAISHVWPPRYLGTEEMHGIILALPILLVGLYAFIPFIKAKHPLRYPLLCCLTLSVASASILFFFAGACSRYVPELIVGWTIFTVIGMFTLLQKQRKFLLAFLGIWSILYSLLASAGHIELFKHTNPRLYHALAHTLDYPSEWLIKMENPPLGVYRLTVTLPSLPPKSRDLGIPLLASGRINVPNELYLLRTTPTKAVLLFMEDHKLRVKSKPFATLGSSVTITVNAPWLYPPADHPYWDHLKDTLQYNQFAEWFFFTTPEHTEQFYSDFSFDPVSFLPRATTHPNPVAWISQAEVIPLTNFSPKTKR